MKINIDLNDNKLKFFDELSKLNNITIEESVLKFIDDRVSCIKIFIGFIFFKKIK